MFIRDLTIDAAYSTVRITRGVNPRHIRDDTQESQTIRGDRITTQIILQILAFQQERIEDLESKLASKAEDY